VGDAFSVSFVYVRSGNGNQGLIPDCGYIDVPVGGCVTNDGEDVCNGRGICSNSTSPARTCECYEGFSGITCELRECPLVSSECTRYDLLVRSVVTAYLVI
jgi:hypothetical protein